MKRSAILAALVAALFSLPLFAQEKDTYLWPHPKLGPQKIDRATKAPVRTTPSPTPITGATLPLSAHEKETYLWLHPKLGPQKIDRATNVPVRTTQAPLPATSTTRVWIDPKGNIKRIAQAPSSSLN